MLLLHITVALLGILASTIAVLWPSSKKIYLSSLLIVMTIASGFGLVLVTKTHILQTCISGLVYVSFTSALLILARLRLNNLENDD